MTIKHWITLEMMILFAYENCGMQWEVDGNYYRIRISTNEEDKITPKIFEGELKTKLRWEGQDYFERLEYNLEYNDKEEEKYEYCKKFVKKLYPNWFKTNATDFIMGD